ncbi:MAG: hypothetical protein J0L92_31605 [Deltaproteobacteria bacterium]|nr:hypothetical protein [Deltaproteobacteria bacterium]
MTLDATLLAIAWGASLVALRVPGVPFGSGFVLASVLAAVVLVRTIKRPALRDALARSQWPRAAVLVLVAHALPAALGAAPITSWMAIARLSLVLVFASLMHVHAGSPAREGVSRAATVFLCASIVAFVLGLVVPSVHALVVVEGAHQHVGRLDRFAALTGLPATTGLWALLAMGAARAHGDARVRTASTVAGLFVATVSLSVATLAVPVVVAGGLVSHARARLAVMLVAAAVAIAALWMHPLALRVGEHTIASSSLHEGWHHEALGARHHPVHETALGPVTITWHATAYALLAERAIDCFFEHPVLGVGPARFAERCPVTTMNTYGEWSAARRAHHQLGAWIAELGLVGVALLGLASWLVRPRRASLDALDGWQCGVLGALAIGLFTGELLETIPVLGWLALLSADGAITPPEAPRSDRAAPASPSVARSDAT